MLLAKSSLVMFSFEEKRFVFLLLRECILIGAIHLNIALQKYDLTRFFADNCIITKPYFLFNEGSFVVVFWLAFILQL